MTTTRKQYSPKFKARVAVEAIRGEKTLSQLGSQFKVHPIQIAKWRKSALEQLPELFVDGRNEGQISASAAQNGPAPCIVQVTAASRVANPPRLRQTGRLRGPGCLSSKPG